MCARMYVCSAYTAHSTIFYFTYYLLTLLFVANKNRPIELIESDWKTEKNTIETKPEQ